MPTVYGLTFVIALGIAAPRAAAAQRLNNFVIELVNVTNAKPGGYAFELADEGWVFVRTTGAKGTEVRLSGVDQPLVKPEAMRFLPAGRHKVSLKRGGAKRLEVRRIPEIRYCLFQYDPWVVAYGPYDWKFLGKHVLPHVNTIIGQPGGGNPARGDLDVDHGVYAKPWQAQGKRWIVEVLAPGIFENKGLPVKETFKQLVEPMVKRPWIDGILIDEYGNGQKPLFDPTVGAIQLMQSDRRMAGKTAEPYVGGHPRDSLATFVRRCFELDCRVAVERYNAERPTEKEARGSLRRQLVGSMKAFREVTKDPQKRMVMALGIMSGPPESLNAYPQVNYRVFQDMEFHLLANDPEFNGLFGIMGYTSGYAEEETIRWLGRLYRHYCIEGKTERLTDEPYELKHVINSDFEDGTAGWDVRPAEEDSIATRNVKGFGSQQGRYGAKKGAGDTVLVMKRSARGPNAVTQEIKGLEPGKLYALRMFSSSMKKASSYRNPTFEDYTTLNIGIDNVTLVPEKCFRHIFLSIHDKPENRMYFNYWMRVFRAKGKTARLTISDWQSPTERFGNVGAETGFNFIEIQPYFGG